jgi:hypothetical protein
MTRTSPNVGTTRKHITVAPCFDPLNFQYVLSVLCYSICRAKLGLPFGRGVEGEATWSFPYVVVWVVTGGERGRRNMLLACGTLPASCTAPINIL